MTSGLFALAVGASTQHVRLTRDQVIRVEPCLQIISVFRNFTKV
jgi:hypothetical protein